MSLGQNVNTALENCLVSLSQQSMNSRPLNQNKALISGALSQAKAHRPIPTDQILSANISGALKHKELLSTFASAN